MSIIKVAEHTTANYYKVAAGKDEQFIKVSKFDNYTEDKILEAYTCAEVPSYIPDSHIDGLFTNPLRLFTLSIYKSGAELNPVNMSIWEYEALIKHNSNTDPAFKMAYISQDEESGTYCVNCEACDYESRVNSESVKKVYNWLHDNKKELERLLSLEYVAGDILY